MTIGMPTAMRDARMQVLLDALDTGAGANATIKFYGAGVGRPATGAAITDQTLIGTLDMSAPSGTITTGVLTLSTVTDDVSADADADIGWARFLDKDGAFVIDASCGLTGSGEDIIFNTLTARIGGVVQVLSGSFTEGNI